MEQGLLNKVTEDLKEKYPNVGIKSIEVNDQTGQTSFFLEPTKKSLAFIDAKAGGGVIPHVYRDKAAVISRDYVQRTNLALSVSDPYVQDPKESFKRAIKYYYI